MKLFSVLDVKSDSFQAPFAAPTNGVATRMFGDAASDRKTVIGLHPEDFKLVLVGMFNESTGELQAMEHQSLGFATEFVSGFDPDRRQEVPRG